VALSPEAIDALLAIGVTAEQLAAVVKAEIAAEAARNEVRLEAKRAGNAERQRRLRERNAPSRDVTPVTRDGRYTPPMIDNSTPPSLTLSEANASSSVPPTPKKRARKVSERTRLPSDFALPDDWRADALASGAPPAQVPRIFQRFHGWSQEPGESRAKVNWFKTWHNWVLGDCMKFGWAPVLAVATGPPPMTARERELEAHYTEKMRREREQSQAVLRNGSGLHHQAQAGDGGEPDDGDPAGERGMELMGNLFPFPVRRSAGGLEDGDERPVSVLHSAGAVSRSFR
jgi:hypothetical protein